MAVLARRAHGGHRDAFEADEAPTLPAYFTATNDPREADVAGSDRRRVGRVGDAGRRRARATFRARSTITDVYDRIAHNLYSINYVWALVAGFLVMFMQAGFMYVETGLCRAKNAAHTVGDELHDLPARLPRLLGLRLRDRLGQLVERSGAAGLVSVARARPVDC